MDLPQPLPKLDESVEALKRTLGDNLHSCLLYGSAVRGGRSGNSDIDLLIVLVKSTPEAHVAIRGLLSPPLDPFILGLEGLERSLQAFALKFLSIRRNYRVLCGKIF